MSEVAVLRWRWQPDGPLVTGYSQNLAQATGEIRRGQRNVINLKTRDEAGELRPAFLAASVKGVFRTAAAWLVERAARELGAEAFVTCDYALAVPEKWRPCEGIPKKDRLCPVCRVFGGSGCLGGSKVAPATRSKARVSFTFSHANDAAYGTARRSPLYRFAWETIADRGKPLQVEQLQFAPDTHLDARIEPSDEFALASLLLSADLISSGFFRFGRFTTRGYGVVRLIPHSHFTGELNALLLGEDGLTPDLCEGKQTNRSIARTLLACEPLSVLQEVVSHWMQ